MAEETIGVGGGRPGGPLQSRTLGPYQIEKQLGRGGMAVVYQAKHITLERTVALKVLLPSLSGDTEFVNRFLEEARSAARLDNPQIVPIYDSGEISGTYYIAMKLLEGKDLKTLLDERRAGGTPGLPLETAISFASQMAVALDYAHKHKLVHRDIKPANIIVDAYNRVTLTDFGIARALDRASSTLTGTVIGTPTYMSPEQAQGKPADYRSDIYSLGVVIYEMLTGGPPFSGNPQTVMYAHVFTPPPPLDNIKADLPPGIGDVIEHALAKNAEDRFQSAGQLALALSNASTGQLSADALRTSNRTGPFYTEDPSTITNTPTGPQTLPAGRTQASTLAQPAGGVVGVPYAPERKAAPLGAILGIGGALAALIVAGLLWYLLAGPGAGGGDGTITVNSDPPGATVTVDGNKLGVTPLAAQKLPPGTHDLVLEKPTYAKIQRKEKIVAKQTDRVNASLTPALAFDLLQVKESAVADKVEVDANGTITAIDRPITQAKRGQPVYVIETVVQKDPNQRDVSFKWEFALFDPNGNRLTSTPVPPGNATVKKGDAELTTLTASFNTTANADKGAYQIKLFVDGKEIDSKTVTLTD